MPDFDSSVLLSSFEPFLNCHREAIGAALEQAPKLVVLVGSARAARTLRHPWTAQERVEMIRAGLPPAHHARVDIRLVADHLYSPTSWQRELQEALADLAGAPARVLQIGFAGGTPLLPGFHYAGIMQRPALAFLPLRGAALSDDADALADVAPPSTLACLRRWRGEDWFAMLQREYRYIADFRKSWAVAPYPPTLVTTDALVLHEGHLLLIERAREPGKGLWALPGGFVEENETLLVSCLRELHEETGLDLRGRSDLVQRPLVRTYDAPHRSMRGRMITHVYRFDLHDAQRPPVAGGDDASHARWIPLAHVMRMESEIFEDHFHMVRDFIG